ncbi:MAG: hypothetical protein JXQ82_09880 [Methanomicrobiaceae archaeon]|nr:hypothetical protein [Methanomicrobiaceae archaeon]
MRNPEDIMADYLLKGGKMLDKACPVCGVPLFTVKGETFCVVCRENGKNTETAPLNPSLSEEKVPAKSKNSKKEPEEYTGDDILCEELKSTLISLCGRIKNENRPKDCLLLMESVSIGIDALKRL